MASASTGHGLHRSRRLRQGTTELRPQLRPPALLEAEGQEGVLTLEREFRRNRSRRVPRENANTSVAGTPKETGPAEEVSGLPGRWYRRETKKKPKRHAARPIATGANELKFAGSSICRIGHVTSWRYRERGSPGRRKHRGMCAQIPALGLSEASTSTGESYHMEMRG